jgi:hypothetical protein
VLAECADLTRKQGNELLQKGLYTQAIDKYTQGILLDPKNPLLPANRALAYLKLKK